MSTIVQLGPHWPAFRGIEFLMIFGDSYSAVGYELDPDSIPHALEPLGFPYPGLTWNEENKPNWVGHLITEYCPAPRYFPHREESEQDPAYLRSPLLVYDYARGGDTIAGVQYQISTGFLPKVGQKPSWAPWTDKTSLFITWVGINDLAFSANPSPAMEKLLRLHKDLYEAGARNFLFIDVPPIERSPAYPVAFCDTDSYTRWNESLKETAEKFASQHEDATVLLYSSHALFTRLLDSPEEYDFPPDHVRKAGGSIWVDALHPTSRVHEFVAQGLGEFLYAVGKKHGPDTK